MSTLHRSMASQTTTPAGASSTDVQAGLPATQVGLSRVGVTGVEKVIRVQVGSQLGGVVYAGQLLDQLPPPPAATPEPNGSEL